LTSKEGIETQCFVVVLVYSGASIWSLLCVISLTTQPALVLLPAAAAVVNTSSQTQSHRSCVHVLLLLLLLANISNFLHWKINPNTPNKNKPFEL